MVENGIARAVNVTSKKWWIDYAQTIVAASVAVIIISLFTESKTNLYIGISFACVFSVIAFLTSLKSQGLKTFTGGPKLVFGNRKAPEKDYSDFGEFEKQFGLL